MITATQVACDRDVEHTGLARAGGPNDPEMPSVCLVAASASLLWALPRESGAGRLAARFFLTCIFRTTFFDRGLSPYDGSQSRVSGSQNALGMAVFHRNPLPNPHIVRRVLDVLLELRNGNKRKLRQNRIDIY